MHPILLAELSRYSDGLEGPGSIPINANFIFFTASRQAVRPNERPIH
jgi:hypothetical protein